MRQHPLQAVLLGVAAIGFAVFLLIMLLFADPPGATRPDQMLFIGGTVTSSGEVPSGKNHRALEIWIGKMPLPFRCFDGPYPGSFDRNILAQLAPGKEVKVGLLPADFESPRLNRAQGQRFYPIRSLEIESHPALSLEAYNLWEGKNRKTGLIVALAFGLVGWWSLRSGLAAYRAKSWSSRRIVARNDITFPD